MHLSSRSFSSSLSAALTSGAVCPPPYLKGRRRRAGARVWGSPAWCLGGRRALLCRQCGSTGWAAAATHLRVRKARREGFVHRAHQSGQERSAWERRGAGKCEPRSPRLAQCLPHLRHEFTSHRQPSIYPTCPSCLNQIHKAPALGVGLALCLTLGEKPRHQECSLVSLSKQVLDVAPAVRIHQPE